MCQGPGVDTTGSFKTECLQGCKVANQWLFKHQTKFRTYVRHESGHVSQQSGWMTGVWFPAWTFTFFFLSPVSRPAFGPTQSPIQWVPRVKRPEREAGGSITQEENFVNKCARNVTDCPTDETGCGRTWKLSASSLQVITALLAPVGRRTWRCCKQTDRWTMAVRPPSCCTSPESSCTPLCPPVYHGLRTIACRKIREHTQFTKAFWTNIVGLRGSELLRWEVIRLFYIAVSIAELCSVESDVVWWTGKDSVVTYSKHSVSCIVPENPQPPFGSGRLWDGSYRVTWHQLHIDTQYLAVRSELEPSNCIVNIPQNINQQSLNWWSIYVCTTSTGTDGHYVEFVRYNHKTSRGHHVCIY
jgi:hypothetical protein